MIRIPFILTLQFYFMGNYERIIGKKFRMGERINRMLNGKRRQNAENLFKHMRKWGLFSFQFLSKKHQDLFLMTVVFRSHYWLMWLWPHTRKRAALSGLPPWCSLGPRTQSLVPRNFIISPALHFSHQACQKNPIFFRTVAYAQLLWIYILRY